MVQKLLAEPPSHKEASTAKASAGQTHTPTKLDSSPIGPSPSAVTNQTNFFGSVSGNIHTGSGSIRSGGRQNYRGEAESGQSVERTGQQAATGRLDTTQLRQMIVDHFNKGELRSLCFDLGIDYEDLAGSGKVDKARELIEYCERHGRAAELISACRRLRPHLTWPSFA